MVASGPGPTNVLGCAMLGGGENESRLPPLAASCRRASRGRSSPSLSGSLQGLSPASLQPLAALAKQALEAHSSAAPLLHPAALPASWPARAAEAAQQGQACHGWLRKGAQLCCGAAGSFFCGCLRRLLAPALPARRMSLGGKSCSKRAPLAPSSWRGKRCKSGFASARPGLGLGLKPALSLAQRPASCLAQALPLRLACFCALPLAPHLLLWP